MKLLFGYTILMFAFAAAAAAAPAAPATFNGSSVSDGHSAPAVSSPLSEPTATTVETASATSSPDSSSVDSPSGTSSTDPATHSSFSSSVESTTPATSSVATSSSVDGTSTSISSADAPTSTATVPSSTQTITDTSTTAPATSSSSATSSSVEVTSSTQSPSTTTSSQATSSAASQPTSAPVSVDKQVYLDAHNAVRAQFGASPLTWSDDLQAKAQGYAEQCQLKHSDGALGEVGENLAAATGSFTEQGAVALFTQDKDQFNKRNVVMSHFTQVVWKSTTQLGCGIASCPGLFGDRRGTATYHVCLYDPVGNVVGEEKDNLPIN